MSSILISSLLGTLIGGRVPGVLVDFLSEALPVAVDSVRRLRDMSGNGSLKASTVADLLAELADEHLDERGLRWRELSESVRDEMLYGLVEWVYVYDTYMSSGDILVPSKVSDLSRMVRSPFLWLDFFRSDEESGESRRSRRRKMRRKLLSIFRKKSEG